MNHRAVTLVALAAAILVSLTAMVQAATYSPCVSMGQWVEYGNFEVAETGVPSELSTMGWLQDNMIYVAIAIIIVLVVIVVAFMLTRKKPSLTPPSPEEAAPETQPTSALNT